MSNKNLMESFAHAFEGFSHVLWTQRHARYQVFIVMLVLLLAYVLQLNITEVLFILSAAAMVIIAELFNTAIEVVVNMITESFHPKAKIAKDVAAAGVLLASTYAVLVGGAIFGKKLFYDNTAVTQFFHFTLRLQDLPKPNPVILILLGVGVVSIMVALAKIRVGHGTILRGGAVSGHTAVAFLLFGAVLVYSQNLFVSTLALCLAILVAQSRVEGKIHTIAEVVWGATVALVLMVLLLLFGHVP